MSKYYAITYRLFQRVCPADAIKAIESVMEKHCACYHDALWNFSCSIIEYEQEGKRHFNRERNAVQRMRRKYPALAPYYNHICRQDEDGHLYEEDRLANFSAEDYALRGSVDFSLIREIILGVPRPYAFTDTELILDFGASLHPAHGAPMGNYIFYSRESAGSEKHSYLIFGYDEECEDEMRGLFLDVAALLPGRYEGTEVKE